MLSDLPPWQIFEPVSLNDLSFRVSELSFTFTSAVDEIAIIDFPVSCPEFASAIWKSVHKITVVLGTVWRDELAFSLTTTLQEGALVQFAIHMLQLTLTCRQSINKVTLESAAIREVYHTFALALAC